MPKLLGLGHGPAESTAYVSRQGADTGLSHHSVIPDLLPHSLANPKTMHTDAYVMLVEVMMRTHGTRRDHCPHAMQQSLSVGMTGRRWRRTAALKRIRPQVRRLSVHALIALTLFRSLMHVGVRPVTISACPPPRHDMWMCTALRSSLMECT